MFSCVESVDRCFFLKKKKKKLKPSTCKNQQRDEVDASPAAGSKTKKKRIAWPEATKLSIS
jgi:hypothetical protein